MRIYKLSLYCLFAVAIFTMISCGTSPSANLPEYKLLKINEPNINKNGEISPSQNLEYFIEIDHPLQQDSLELLQDYFIEKGKSDFRGINKVIVRVYLKGASVKSLPYASLILIGEKKEIIITGSAKNVDFLNEKFADYELLGCWTVYEDVSYVICKKEGQYYSTYVDKKNQSVEKLEQIKTKNIKGETAYYSENDKHHEYTVIKDDGLYIYDETGESGPDAVIWSNDPTWNNR